GAEGRAGRARAPATSPTGSLRSPSGASRAARSAGRAARTIPERFLRGAREAPRPRGRARPSGASHESPVGQDEQGLVRGPALGLLVRPAPRAREPLSVRFRGDEEGLGVRFAPAREHDVGGQGAEAALTELLESLLRVRFP